MDVSKYKHKRCKLFNRKMETFSSMSMKNKYEIGMFIQRFMFIYSRDVANENFLNRGILPLHGR